MKSFPNTLVIICLNGEFGKMFAQKLARKLDKTFINCESYIAEKLLNTELTSAQSIDYLEKQEKVCLENCLVKENLIMNTNFDIYKRNKSLFERIKLYYIKLPASLLSDKDKINLLSYDKRNMYLMDNCHQVIELSKLDVNEALKKF